MPFIAITRYKNDKIGRPMERTPPVVVQFSRQRLSNRISDLLVIIPLSI